MKNAAFLAIIVLLSACSASKKVMTNADGSMVVHGMNYSNTFTSKGKSLDFGQFEVSRAKYKLAQETDFYIGFLFFSFAREKTKMGYSFSAKDSSKEVKVKSSATTKVDYYGRGEVVNWFELPADAEQIQMGSITGEGFNWEYIIHDENWLKSNREIEVGALTNGSKTLKLKLARRRLVFYQADEKVGELQYPFNNNYSVWLKEDLDADSKLAISAVCGAILLKIKDER